MRKPIAAESIGGPGQPESKAFHPADNTNMVDLFTGDFSYTIPLMDVGGYPITIGYNSGVTMDQEASWVGLGWNLNPGAITRNMRGLPDEFNGTDSIEKITSIKDSRTIGVSLGAGVEVVGTSIDKIVKKGIAGSLGVFHNTYRGWGIETSLDATINLGAHGQGPFTAGLSLTNNSQEGVTLSPSLSFKTTEAISKELGGFSGGLSLGTAYNSRTGMKALQLSSDIWAPSRSVGLWRNTGNLISFAYPSYTPTISIPYTNSMFSATFKIGGEVGVVHPSATVTGDVATQYIAPEDQRRKLPAYGYLNYQNATDPAALLDFNREKDIPYREKPAVPNVAVPSYTYDVFSMTGEGTGGMFRAYRGDIGFVHDPYMKTGSGSDRISLDVGLGNIAHGGVDLNFVDAYTETGPWKIENPLATTIGFKKSDKLFEASYFRNPAEKVVNTRSFYDAIGGDDLVTADIYQPGNSSSLLTTTGLLDRYRNKRYIDQVPLRKETAFKTARDKRTQVISYLTAKEASVVGLNKYIENYTPNTFGLYGCNDVFPDETTAPGTGLLGNYYKGELKFRGLSTAGLIKTWKGSRVDSVISFQSSGQLTAGLPDMGDIYYVTWTGKLKADITGPYEITTDSDDGAVLVMNGQEVSNRWDIQGEGEETMGHAHVNLVAGETYDIELRYFQYKKKAAVRLYWEYPSHSRRIIPKEFLYPPSAKDTFSAGIGLNATGEADTLISKEKRVNGFRKENHLSEIDVLNTDGRRYVYGLPVYNLKQQEATFAVNAANGNLKDGLVKYKPGEDDTTLNQNGIDHYFNREEVPAYPHSFLLTGILSPDYADLTGNGISDDDPGDAVKFNYSKVAGIHNPFSWRAPYTDSAGYSEGLRTDSRDDKGNYVYGEKELWYLHSIESKNMIATFKVGERKDLLAIDRTGHKMPGPGKRLEEINLYTKADFMKNGFKATPVKTVHFRYSYRLCRGVNGTAVDSGKLTLDSIFFTYNGNSDDKGKRNPYVFYYNSKNPDYNIKSYDRWGNYKDPLQNPGSTAANPITNAEYPYALQDSTIVAANAAAWTLDSIAQPAGGRLKITYEGDDYGYVQNKRAAQLFKIAGFAASAPDSLNDLSNRLYSQQLDDIRDHLYVAIKVPRRVTTRQQVYAWYLEGLQNAYFKLFVKMPADQWGNGNEYVPCYGTLDLGGGYGFIDNGNTIWVKIRGIENDGTDGGSSSPLAKAAIQFLRLNLPSKAFQGSEVGDDVSLASAVQAVLGMTENVMTMFSSFDHTARMKGWAKEVDLNRTYIRLDNPFLKKYGGGLRVKRIVTYDHWNTMTGQQESVYGQEYQYTTTKLVNGVQETISSGVAAYEPILGGEENPWRVPIQYAEQVAALAPVTDGYTEAPLGESFFPAPVVGYSKVRVRSIHTKNTRSANGYTETSFFTAYDFPTIVERTELADNKKRYKPAVANFLRIDAKHFLAVSQGFKVELNDMHGKIRSQATYGEADPNNYITYTENFYHVDDINAEFKHLNNTVRVLPVFSVDQIPIVDSTASIGKDVELMVDMREQHSVTNAYNIEINTEMFAAAVFPFIIPSLLNLAQRDETKFRSVATTKVINRHGIIDSVLAIDKGSRVVTASTLYDGESGEPIVTSTQNEFNDPLYHTTYSAAWMYDGMGGAYKNIGLTMDNIDMKEGRITHGLPAAMTAGYFASGDELLIWSKPKTSGADCNPDIATWPSGGKIWALDGNMMNGGTPNIYFIDANGVPFSGNDISLKVIRSGRRNMVASMGELTTLVNPVLNLGSVGGPLVFLFVSSGPSRVDYEVTSANATEFKQFWKAEDHKKAGIVTNCIPSPYNINDCSIRTFVNHPAAREILPLCPDGASGEAALIYKVAGGIYSSTISQEDADAKAAADIAANGQAYANANGTCVYKNKGKSQSFNKQCPGGVAGSAVLYTVGQGIYSSAVSQDDADAQAQADIDRNGQHYADSIGTCGPPRRITVRGRLPEDTPDAMFPFGISVISTLTHQPITYTADPPINAGGGTFPYYISFDMEPNDSYQVAVVSQSGIYAIVGNEEEFCNSNGASFQAVSPSEIILSKTEFTTGNDERTVVLRKNDCSSLVGSLVKYTVPANTIFALGKDAANALAQQQIDQQAQGYANTNGICVPVASLTVRKKPNAPSASGQFRVIVTNTDTQEELFNQLFDGTPFPDFQFPNLPVGNYRVEIAARMEDVVAAVNADEKTVKSATSQFWNATGPIVIEMSEQQQF
ncbi:DUF5977 domain-containing protein [Chitinophaga agrisoli]|nr:DUF5977 domain-containing protein [Chitinophaga agrisoli]